MLSCHGSGARSRRATQGSLASLSKPGIPGIVNNVIAGAFIISFRKHREYAQCVTQRIEERNNMIDHLTDNVISIQNLESALDLYCKNQDRKSETSPKTC